MIQMAAKAAGGNSITKTMLLGNGIVTLWIHLLEEG
jgi:hypothetical protein